jgi:acetolactate synthase-1/2/3 large subunit
MSCKHVGWIEQCKKWKAEWPVYQDIFSDEHDGINIYAVIEALNNNTNSNDVFITDAGTAAYAVGQNLKLSKNQKLVMPGAQGDMGFALPASVGAYLNNIKSNVIVITGDGSFNTNIQELATIKSQNANIKFVVLNNKGYLSIRNTQKNYFNNHVYGESSETGLWFPNLLKISEAYEIKYYEIKNIESLDSIFKNTIHNDEAIIYDVDCKFWQEVVPSLALKLDKKSQTYIQVGLDDMYPFIEDII